MFIYNNCPGKQCFDNMLLLGTSQFFLNRKRLLRDFFLKSRYIFLRCLFVYCNEKNIPVEVIFKPSYSTNQISKINC